ncbi:MAG: adenosylcobinamide-GDP ribazoletransferase [Desulfatirhabdiaceae bacterium]
MKHLTSALAFLTILPIRGSTEFDTAKMIPFFPVVGLIVGALLSIVDALAIRIWPGPAAAAIDVVFLMGITGAFHLDGLADTADGLLGHRSRERALEIMKDSRIGVMGACALIACILLKWAGLAHMGPERSLALILIPAYARAGILFGMKMLPYGRSTGTGLAFFGNSLPLSAFVWLLIPIGGSFFLGLAGIVMMGMFFLILRTLLFWYKKRMGCITGDMMGAITEMIEAVLFLTISAGGIL